MTKRQAAKEAKRLQAYRDEMDAYFEHRYRHIGDWTHKPIPKDAPEPLFRKDKDSQG